MYLWILCQKCCFTSNFLPASDTFPYVKYFMPCGITLCYLRTNNNFLEFLKNFESLPWCHLKDMWRTGGVIILTISLQFLLSPVTVTQGSFDPSEAALALSSSSTGEREDRSEGQVVESSWSYFQFFCWD